MSSSANHIRNFVIIAHIDHGKSTLADRLLEITGTVDKRHLKPQYLDRLESERERGITIKMAPVRMIYRSQKTPLVIPSEAEGSHESTEYILNLIDTPGHSDFSYEVSRALAAVEGAVLLVDATQGIQAQTLANFEAAKKAGLTIIGAVSKIDLNPSDLEETIKSLAKLIGVELSAIIKVSGKTGVGVPELLEAIIEKIPPPASPRQPDNQAVLAAGEALRAGSPPISVSETHIARALIFDSLYDEHKGIIAFVRLFNGQFQTNDSIKFIATAAVAKIKEVGIFNPELKPTGVINEGEIGYIATGIKDVDKIKIGDTIVHSKEIIPRPLPGYAESQPVVFTSFYPEDADNYDNLKQALDKLRLNDAALFFEPDKSELLGRGFKCGFLGKLHFEITDERLEKEFNIITVHSFPTVAYLVKTKTGEIIINNPKNFPDDYLQAQEPLTEVEIICPPAYLGSVLNLKNNYRFGSFQTISLDDRLLIKTTLPLADLISDLHDKLKSVTQGYASLSYKIIGYQENKLKKMEIVIASRVIPGLTRILPEELIEREARKTVEKLKELLPKQQFVQAIQAAVDHRIVARETIPALKKDVTGYLYGGDRTRKEKLWKKQKRGKEKLKQRAGEQDIKISSQVFRELLKK